MFSKRSDTWDARRFGVLLLALLQLGAVGVQSADAILEADGAALPTHVESHRSEDCGLQHDHLFCQVVRALSAVSQHRDTLRVTDLRGPVSVRLVTSDVFHRPAVDPDGATRPRAPPVA